MPIANTKPNIDRLLSENPNTAITANVPIIETGMASSGTSAARQFCKNTNTTSATSADRFEQCFHDILNTVADERRRIVRNRIIDAGRKILL